ncbi:hypothetical protein CC78DRAFT_613964 [Lojkania enalia]|uniref:Uncharacterized protein n=1 Tax=Lojkania enalia TaxID=147567 RepID=A0A9P4KIZ0_9PLEO|nr:hypothetical protein CC78DRAFT_613964 [Didymosphaeria enalia]
MQQLCGASRDMLFVAKEGSSSGLAGLLSRPVQWREGGAQSLSSTLVDVQQAVISAGTAAGLEGCCSGWSVKERALEPPTRTTVQEVHSERALCRRRGCSSQIAQETATSWGVLLRTRHEMAAKARAGYIGAVRWEGYCRAIRRLSSLQQPPLSTPAESLRCHSPSVPWLNSEQMGSCRRISASRPDHHGPPSRQSSKACQPPFEIRRRSPHTPQLPLISISPTILRFRNCILPWAIALLVHSACPASVERRSTPWPSIVKLASGDTDGAPCQPTTGFQGRDGAPYRAFAVIFWSCLCCVT